MNSINPLNDHRGRTFSYWGESGFRTSCVSESPRCRSSLILVDPQYFRPGLHVMTKDKRQRDNTFRHYKVIYILDIVDWDKFKESLNVTRSNSNTKIKIDKKCPDFFVQWVWPQSCEISSLTERKERQSLYVRGLLSDVFFNTKKRVTFVYFILVVGINHREQVLVLLLSERVFSVTLFFQTI